MADKPRKVGGRAPKETAEKIRVVGDTSADLSKAFNASPTLSRARKLTDHVKVDGYGSKSTYLKVAVAVGEDVQEVVGTYIAVRFASNEFRVHLHPNLEAHSEKVQNFIGKEVRYREKYVSRWVKPEDFEKLMDLLVTDRSYAILLPEDAEDALKSGAVSEHDYDEPMHSYKPKPKTQASEDDGDEDGDDVAATDKLAEQAVYESSDVPGMWGYVGCDEDCYETKEDAMAAWKEANGFE